MHSLSLLLCSLALVGANPVKVGLEQAPPVSKDAALAYALDISTSVSLSTMQCFKQQGYATVFIRAYRPDGNGAYDTSAGPNINNAYQAGLGTEVFVVPQPSSSKSAAQQVDEFYQGLVSAGITVRSVWFQITSPINWPNNQNTNRNFISALVSRAQTQYHLSVGIYTNSYDWNQITGAWTGLQSGVNLWYWNVYGNGVSGESPANFNDFRAFGSWTSPAAKQFAQAESVCNTNVNRDVYMTGASVSRSVLMENGKIVVGGNIHA